jgi:hypothetical protein
MFATLIEKSPFVLVAAVIDKAKLAAQHAAPPNPYHLALKFGLERVQLHRRDLRDEGKVHQIPLNWRVIQAPLALVDYVVAHELTHLEHPNHTAAFWAAHGRAMPDYDARKERLRVSGPELEW